MAKVSDLKFDIGNEKVVVNINCNSGGQFTAKIPKIVADELDLQPEVIADTLKDVVSQVSDAVNRFKTAKTSEELHIAIQYGSNGDFNQDAKGKGLHNQHRSEGYNIDISFGEHKNCLSFNHKVVVRRTVAGVVKWYEAELGKDFPHWDKVKRKPNDWYINMDDVFYDSEKWKMIPFSKAALESLNNAKEKLRSLSELLYRFIEQDQSQIESTLTKTKFLN